MSHALTRPVPRARPADRSAPPPLWRDATAVLLGCALVLALTAGKAVAVWRTGIFFNPDDAMRAVEVRDFLGGQGWFDLVPRRLAPGHGVPMHWSRLADLAVAGPVLLFRAVASPDAAERLGRLLEPVLLLAGFMACQARLGRLLLPGPGAALAACLLSVGGLETTAVFIPGHIHHHGLQVMLLAALAAEAVAGIGAPRGRAGRFAAAGGLTALSLAVNLQNLPFVAVPGAALVLGWILQGEAFARALRAYAAALAAATGLVFLVQVPPDRWAERSCDAFAAPHLAACWAAGLAALGLGFATPRLRSPLRRGGAAALLGLAAALAVGSAYPGCLTDPFSGVDPLLRSRWLADVGEVLPLAELVRRSPAAGWPIAAMLAAGTVAMAAALAGSSGAARARWAVAAGFLLAGLAGTAWAVRVAASAEGFAALGGAFALCRLFDPARPRRPLAALLCTVTGLALTQAGWAAVLHRFPSPPGAAAARPVDPVACFAPAAYAGLGALPPGLVLSTIDPGSQILAYTAHSVLAAPYHRNGYGNRTALLFFDAGLDRARAIATAAGADYVVLCLTSPEVVEDAARRPDGVAAAVLNGEAPAWLRPLGGTAGPVRVFGLVRPGA